MFQDPFWQVVLWLSCGFISLAILVVLIFRLNGEVTQGQFVMALIAVPAGAPLLGLLLIGGVFAAVGWWFDTHGDKPLLKRNPTKQQPEIPPRGEWQ